MSGFIDQYPPRTLMKFKFRAMPKWSTTITAVSSGSERRTSNWYNPIHHYVAPAAINCLEIMQDVHDMWMALRGPFYSFPFKDPLDFASAPVTRAATEPVLSRVDQVLAIGDGSTKEFQLYKSYTFGTQEYRRTIQRPVVSSVLIGVDGEAPGDVAPVDGGPYVVSTSRDGGIVTFDKAPRSGDILTAGFLFDVECRFEADDSYEKIVQSFGASETADLVFKEIRPCI